MPESTPSTGRTRPDRVLIFDRDPRHAEAYRTLFEADGCAAEAAQPNDPVQAICERFQPDLVIFDMAFWEADTAYVFGILNLANGFPRPVIIGLSTLEVQTRRAKRFGADAIWIRGVDDATGLPALARELLEKRRAGVLAIPAPRTPL